MAQLGEVYQRYIDECYELAKNSTCAKAKYGSIIVREVPVDEFTITNEVVGRGWNHIPNPACDDCASLCSGGIRKGVKSGTRGELCYAVHAEQMAILQAGDKARGAVIFVAGFDSKGNKFLKDHTLPPGDPRAGFYCTLCVRLIWEAGLGSIVVNTVDGPAFESLQDAWRSSYAVANSI